MPKFLVTVHETYHIAYEVEAEDEAEARKIVWDGGGVEKEEYREFCDTADDSSDWNVEERND